MNPTPSAPIRALKELPVADFEVIVRWPELGRSSLVVECKGCGQRSEHFTWSWAGHGGVRCGSEKHCLLWATYKAKAA